MNKQYNLVKFNNGKYGVRCYLPSSICTHFLSLKQPIGIKCTVYNKFDQIDSCCMGTEDQARKVLESVKPKKKDLITWEIID